MYDTITVTSKGPHLTVISSSLDRRHFISAISEISSRIHTEKAVRVCPVYTGIGIARYALVAANWAVIA